MVYDSMASFTTVVVARIRSFSRDVARRRDPRRRAGIHLSGLSSVRHTISYCTLFKAIIATRVHAIDPTRPGRETPQTRTRTRTPAPRPPRAAVMVSAVHGVLITADVPLKQYILHLNDLAPAEGKFLIADLDDRRVLVQPSRADAIRAEIERYQQSTQYVAPTTMTKQ